MTVLPRLLPAIFLLLLGGCAQLPLGPGGVFGDPERIATEINRLRGQARVLRYGGRYGEALERLDTAIGLRPDDADLRAERTETDKDRRRLERLLHDQLLVIEVQSGQQRLPLLRRLLRSDPGGQPFGDELERMRENRNHQIDALSDCGRHQAERNPRLARNCLELALAARDDSADRALLAELTPQPTRPAKTTPRRPTTAGTTVTATDQPWMAKARELMNGGKHYAAIRVLEKVLGKDPDAGDARALLQEARDSLERNMDTMLSTGDRLYSQGRVKEALAVWQAAVEMNPESLPAREKSERALRVLNNINSLREQQ